MPRIKKAGPWNPQKATAYVGKGVLKYGDTIPAVRGHITPVPNGPLIKKKGEFKGSTLKNGGNMAKIKKYQNSGKPVPKMNFKSSENWADNYSLDTTGLSKGSSNYYPYTRSNGTRGVVTRSEAKSLVDKVKSGKLKKSDWFKSGGKVNKIKKADNGIKKQRLKEDSRAYITKVKTDDKGNITSLKSRRTVKGLLSGAPRAKKIMKSGGKITKKSTPKSKKK